MKSAIIFLLLALIAPMAEAKASSHGKEVSQCFVCYPRRLLSLFVRALSRGVCIVWFFVCEMCVSRGVTIILLSRT
jgi:hypothetical protein